LPGGIGKSPNISTSGLPCILYRFPAILPGYKTGEIFLYIDYLNSILYIILKQFQEVIIFSIHGIYENGKIKLLEPVPFKKKAKVIITIVDEIITEKKSVPLDLFDDLIGAISCNKNGSEKHDDYIYSKENL